MCWIQFSQLILRFSFQYVCFVSITSRFICKCDFEAPIFSSPPRPFYPRTPTLVISIHFQQSRCQIPVNVGCCFDFLISHACVSLLFYTLLVSQGIRRTNSTYSVRGCYFSPPKYFFTFIILVPKYSQNKDGGLMGAEIFILYLARLPGYKTR